MSAQQAPVLTVGNGRPVVPQKLPGIVAECRRKDAYKGDHERDLPVSDNFV